MSSGTFGSYLFVTIKATMSVTLAVAAGPHESVCEELINAAG